MSDKGIVRNRVLYIDGIPEGIRLPSLRTVSTREDVAELYEDVFRRQDPPDLVLDCRSLRTVTFNAMLKFLEEYRAAVTLIAMDPVPPPVVSRFAVVEKKFTPIGGSLTEIRLRQLPFSIKAKVYQLFGVAFEERG